MHLHELPLLRVAQSQFMNDIFNMKELHFQMLQRIGNQCESIQLGRPNVLREKPDDCFGKVCLLL